MKKDIQVLDLQEGHIIIKTETNERFRVTNITRGFAFFEAPDGKRVDSKIVDYELNGKQEWMQLPRTAFVKVEA